MNPHQLKRSENNDASEEPGRQGPPRLAGRIRSCIHISCPPANRTAATIPARYLPRSPRCTSTSSTSPPLPIIIIRAGHGAEKAISLCDTSALIFDLVPPLPTPSCFSSLPICTVASLPTRSPIPRELSNDLSRPLPHRDAEKTTLLLPSPTPGPCFCPSARANNGDPDSKNCPEFCPFVPRLLPPVNHLKKE